MARRQAEQVKTKRREAPEFIEQNRFFGLPLDEDQLVFANAIWSDDNDIVFVNANAGSGKTQVATGTAKLLIDYGKFESIVYIMSPYGERQQGWLPGTIEEKSSVYFDAFYQALQTIGVNVNTDVVQEADPHQKGKIPYINCITDTFLRGCNLNHAVVIIDEAQNFTIPQLKKILTRVCKDTKVIVIGHELQCDLDKPELSGFAKYVEHFRNHDRCAVCKLTHNHRGWISNHADSLRESVHNSINKANIILFNNVPDGKYSHLSPWYEAPMVVNDEAYFCVGQFLWHQQAKIFEDHEAAKKILESRDPAHIMSIGREIKNFDQKVWNSVMNDVAYVGNWEKFYQHIDLAQELLRTDNKTIGYAREYDLIWGIGHDPNDPVAQDPSRWRGSNLMGQALMDVRANLKYISRSA